MTEKNTTNKTQNAEFIDLKKTEFKKINSWVKYLFIVLIFLLSFYFIFLFFKDKNSIFNSNELEEILTNEIKIKEVQTEVEASDSFKQKAEVKDEMQNSENLQPQIESIDIRGKNNSQKLMDFELLYKNLEEKLEQSLINNSKETNSDLVNLLARQNLKLFTFLNFKRKVESNEPFSVELNLLKDLYSDIDKIYSYLLFFESFDSIDFKGYDFLISEMNKILENFNSVDTNINYYDTNHLDDSEDIGRKEKIKNYFKKIISSSFRVSKIEKNKSLSDYEDKNYDGIIDFKNHLTDAKEFLLIKDITNSLKKIDQLNSPLSQEIVDWIASAKLMKDVEDNLVKLENEIFNYFLMNYDG